MHYTEHIQKLEAACEWLRIERGRAGQYKKYIVEFFEHDQRSPKHILAYFESTEIVDLFELWANRAEEFPGIMKKLASSIGKGPLLREEENVRTSANRARDDAFTYLVAGSLLQGGARILAVDGISAPNSECCSNADVTFMWNNETIEVECKRPRSESSMRERTKEARRQIENEGRQSRHGVVALDCSVLIREPMTLLDIAGNQDGAGVLQDRLQALAGMVLDHLSDAIAGVIMFARVPAMTCIGKSKILSDRGVPFCQSRPDVSCNWSILPNSACRSSGVAKYLAGCLGRARQRF